MIILLIHTIEITSILKTMFPVDQVPVIKTEARNLTMVIQGITLIGIDKIEILTVYMHSHVE